MVKRLINIDEANTLLRERAHEFGDEPGCVSHFDNQWVSIEGANDIAQPFAVFFGSFEAPRELKQHRAEFPGIHHYIEARSDLIDFPGGPGRIPLVGEAFPKLGGESEVAVISDPPDP